MDLNNTSSNIGKQDYAGIMGLCGILVEVLKWCKALEHQVFQSHCWDAWAVAESSNVAPLGVVPTNKPNKEGHWKVQARGLYGALLLRVSCILSTYNLPLASFTWCDMAQLRLEAVGTFMQFVLGFGVFGWDIHFEAPNNDIGRSGGEAGCSVVLFFWLWLLQRAHFEPHTSFGVVELQGLTHCS